MIMYVDRNSIFITYIYDIRMLFGNVTKGMLFAVPYRVQNYDILQTCLFANLVDIRILYLSSVTRKIEII